MEGHDRCPDWGEYGLSIRLGQVAQDHKPIQRSDITRSASDLLLEVHRAHQPINSGSNLIPRMLSHSPTQQDQGSLVWHSSSSPMTASTIPISLGDHFTPLYLPSTERDRTSISIPLPYTQSSDSRSVPSPQNTSNRSWSLDVSNTRDGLFESTNSNA